MASGFRRISAVQNDNGIRQSGSPQPVGDKYGGHIPAGFPENPVHIAFRYGIQRCGGFIHDAYGGPLIQRSAYGYFMPLTAGKIHAVLFYLPQAGIRPIRQCLCNFPDFIK